MLFKETANVYISYLPMDRLDHISSIVIKTASDFPHCIFSSSFLKRPDGQELWEMRLENVTLESAFFKESFKVWKGGQLNFFLNLWTHLPQEKLCETQISELLHKSKSFTHHLVFPNLNLYVFLLQTQKEDILNNVGIQTTLSPIDFHCMNTNPFKCFSKYLLLSST